jgi:hypothetical protein
MTMLLCHLHTLAERLRDWRAQRKVAREIDALLRGCGFVELAPGVWRRSGQVPPEKGRELTVKAPQTFLLKATRFAGATGRSRAG